ncbi:MAG: hypothetical protein RR272_03440 [Synergistaceae bacterium]
MNIDVKNYPDQDLKMLVHSLELISARIFESVVVTNQTACANTPEMNTMFHEWVSCLGDNIVSLVEKDGVIDPVAISKKIGVSSSTVLSLCLTLHREGKINISSLSAEKTDVPNREICGCIKG